MKAQMLSRAAALLFATLGATAALAMGASASASASPSVQSPCGLIRDMHMSNSEPSTLIIEGELPCGGGGLWARIYRNGVRVISGGNGVGVVNFFYHCRSSDQAHWTVVWSTGDVDEGDFPCT